MIYTLRFFSSKCSLFHNSNVFGSCIIHILYIGCAKIKKNNNSGAKRLIDTNVQESAKGQRPVVSRGECSAIWSGSAHSSDLIKHSPFAEPDSHLTNQ